MKKNLVAITAAFLAATAFAQSAPPGAPPAPNAAVRALFEQLRATHELVKQDKAALESAKQANQPAGITAARAKLEADSATLHKIHEELKAEGVAPPRGGRHGHGGPGGAGGPGAPEGASGPGPGGFGGHGGPGGGHGHPDDDAD